MQACLSSIFSAAWCGVVEYAALFVERLNVVMDEAELDEVPHAVVDLVEGWVLVDDCLKMYI